MIGFTGAPWTLACYMVQGRAGRDFEMVRSVAITQRPFFTQLIALLTKAVTQHALNQIKSGAEVIQLFDSWAGNLSEEQFAEWVIAPTTQIVKDIKSAYPHIPIIGFPRLAGSKYQRLCQCRPALMRSISTLRCRWLGRARNCSRICAVQGNLDPLLLAEDKERHAGAGGKIVSIALGKKSFIFNLGHGILPHTPVENMQALCDLLKNSFV